MFDVTGEGGSAAALQAIDERIQKYEDNYEQENKTTRATERASETASSFRESETQDVKDEKYMNKLLKGQFDIDIQNENDEESNFG